MLVHYIYAEVPQHFLWSHRITLHRRIALSTRFDNKVYSHKAIWDEVIQVKIMDINVERRAKVD
jgi:hypothetical protein